VIEFTPTRGPGVEPDLTYLPQVNAAVAPLGVVCVDVRSDTMFFERVRLNGTNPEIPAALAQQIVVALNSLEPQVLQRVTGNGRITNVAIRK
jgi:hypothetical protein